MHKNQTREKVLIIFKNIVSLCAIISLVLVLIFIIQGWTIKSNGEPVRTGLVQFSTSVNGSTVEIGDKTLSEKTNTKYQVAPGEYEFKMWFKDYELWYRKASVKSGEVLWLNYARLVPVKKNVESFLSFENLKTVKFANNKEKAFAISETAEGLAKFWLIQFGEKPKVTEVELPEKMFERELTEGETAFFKIADKISIESMNENSTRAILKWQNGETAEFIAVNLSNPEESLNLTDNFGLNFSKIEPKNRSHSRLFALADSELREINLDDKTVSANLLSGIVDFDIYNDEISAYIQKKSNEKFAVGIFRANKQTTIIADDFEVKPKIKIGVYYNENYVHILNGQKLTIFKGSDWTGQNQPKKIKEIAVGFDVNSFGANSENRFLKVAGESKTMTFDLETNERFEISASDFRWLDGFVLYNFENGKLVLRDFDGANKQTIFEVLDEFGVMLSKDEKYIWGFSKNEKGEFKLSRVKMIL